MRKQYSTSLYPEIIKQLKLRAVEEDRPSNEVIEDALKNYFKECVEMKYNVLVEFEGQTVKESNGLSKSEAIKKAELEAKDEDCKVFISWFRLSDGQRGYLNPDRDHSITGNAW